MLHREKTFFAITILMDQVFVQSRRHGYKDVHIKNTAVCRLKTSLVIRSDTYVVVLAISMFEKLERGKGKRTAWQIFDDATDTFVRLSETPAVIGDQDMECIEAFCSHPVRQDYDNVCREQCTFRNVCLEAIPV